MSDPRISDLVTKLKGFKDTESIYQNNFTYHHTKI